MYIVGRGGRASILKGGGLKETTASGRGTNIALWIIKKLPRSVPPQFYTPGVASPPRVTYIIYIKPYKYIYLFGEDAVPPGLKAAPLLYLKNIYKFCSLIFIYSPLWAALDPDGAAEGDKIKIDFSRQAASI
jgi:hypothetical protein